jgi:hypothetical protein
LQRLGVIGTLDINIFLLSKKISQNLGNAHEGRCYFAYFGRQEINHDIEKLLKNIGVF